MASDIAGRVHALWDAIETRCLELPRPPLFRPPAASEAVRAFEAELGARLPEEYRALLERHDGGHLLRKYDSFFGIDEIRESCRWMADLHARGVLEGRWRDDATGGSVFANRWERLWVPIARHVGGDYLFLDLAPGPRGERGQLLHWYLGSDACGDDTPGVEEPSVVACLEGFLRDLADPEYLARHQLLGEPHLDGASTSPRPPALGRLDPPFADEVKGAIERGDVTSLRALSPTSHFWSGDTLLATAAGALKRPIVDLLVERGCPIDFGREWGARTALFEACRGLGRSAERAELVSWLLNHGADPNARSGGETPLHVAAWWEHEDALALLVCADGDPQAKNANGATVIEVARRQNRWERLLRAIDPGLVPAALAWRKGEGLP